MSRTTTAWSILLFATCIVQAACGNGSTAPQLTPPPTPLPQLFVDESEPNDASATAGALAMNTAGSGDLSAAGDRDYWSFEATAGQFISVELFGVRCDLDGWNSAGNVPKMTLYDTDGTTPLLRHEFTADVSPGGWEAAYGSYEDLDFPCFRIPATGTYYIGVAQDIDTEAGGRYALRVNLLDLGTVQVEAEGVGVAGVNDTTAAAETLQPGTMRGWHVDDEEDAYSFTITTVPTVVYFEVTANRNGIFGADDDYLDLALGLLDTDGSTFLKENSSAWYDDPAISFKFTTPGTYYIVVGEDDLSGDGAYYLRYGRRAVSPIVEIEDNDDAASAQPIAYGAFQAGTKEAADADWYAFNGQAGDAIRLWLFDWENLQGGTGPLSPEFVAPDGTTVLPSYTDAKQLDVWSTILQSSGTYYVRFTSATDTPYCFLLELYGSAGYESEPNGDIATANALDANDRAAGVIQVDNDVDVYSFTGAINEVVLINVICNEGVGAEDFYEMGSNGDMRVRVLDAQGTELADAQVEWQDDDTAAKAHGVVNPLPSVELCFRPPADGTYYVEITEEGGFSGDDHYYWVWLR